jgi:hypothetical protein
VHYAPGLKLAKFLGWFSVALGALELVFPDAVARWTGVPYPTLLQAYGVREIVCGLGILAVARPVGWLWGRVAGDALDLATLIYVLAAAQTTSLAGTIVSIVAVAGVMVLDVAAPLMLRAGKKLEG